MRSPGKSCFFVIEDQYADSGFDRLIFLFFPFPFFPLILFSSPSFPLLRSLSAFFFRFFLSSVSLFSSFSLSFPCFPLLFLFPLFLLFFSVFLPFFLFFSSFRCFFLFSLFLPRTFGCSRFLTFSPFSPPAFFEVLAFLFFLLFLPRLYFYVLFCGLSSFSPPAFFEVLAFLFFLLFLLRLYFYVLFCGLSPFSFAAFLGCPFFLFSFLLFRGFLRLVLSLPFCTPFKLPYPSLFSVRFVLFGLFFALSLSAFSFFLLFSLLPHFFPFSFRFLRFEGAVNYRLGSFFRYDKSRFKTGFCFGRYVFVRLPANGADCRRFPPDSGLRRSVLPLCAPHA